MRSVCAQCPAEGSRLGPARLVQQQGRFKLSARTFCPGQKKVPDSERVVPRASHGNPLCSHYKGEQRLSKNSRTGWTCNYRARACSSPGLAPHQGTEFCLRIHHFVSGKQDTSTGPFLSPARSHFRLPARGARTTLNLKCEYLGWAQAKITPPHNGQDPSGMGRRRS